MVDEGLVVDEGDVVVGVVELEGVVARGVVGTGVVGAEAMFAGATPPGFERRKSEILFADRGFGMLVPFGTKAMVTSWPSRRRRLPGLVRIVPLFALGDAHTFTWTVPLPPSQD